MNNALAALLIVLCSTNLAAQASDPAGIVGLWRTEDGDVAVKIDKIGNHYQGRIAWLKTDTVSTAPILDANNPEPHLRNIPLKGNKILRELTYNAAKDLWEGGVYYDFENGTLYNCIATLDHPDRLRITKFLRNPNNATDELWRRSQ